MENLQRDVRLFHYGAGHPVAKYPSTPPPATMALRLRLLEEEYTELVEALTEAGYPASAKQLGSIAKESADLIYVVLGILVTYGIDMEPVWKEVQATNMDKLRGPKRDDGKQLKPEGWQAPDIEAIIWDQIDAEAEKVWSQPL